MKTNTAHWDYLNAYEHVCETTMEQMEIGRSKQIEIDQELLAKLKALDPDGWESWYDKTIPEVVSLAEIGRMLSERIDDLTFDPMKVDGYEMPMQIRASLGL